MIIIFRIFAVSAQFNCAISHLCVILCIMNEECCSLNDAGEDSEACTPVWFQRNQISDVFAWPTLTEVEKIWVWLRKDYFLQRDM